VHEIDEFQESTQKIGTANHVARHESRDRSPARIEMIPVELMGQYPATVVVEYTFPFQLPLYVVRISLIW
jgi:hypothetical protein